MLTDNPKTGKRHSERERERERERDRKRRDAAVCVRPINLSSILKSLSSKLIIGKSHPVQSTIFTYEITANFISNLCQR